MKEKEEKQNLEELLKNTKVQKIEIEDELTKSFISYAMAVNVSRAIPDVRDGLKPVHRRILFSMGELNNYSDKPYKKCARIVGEVMGKYHPHGDSSVYEALVRLAQDFSTNEPLVDGHGNFGSVDGDPPAAQRYTEARLSKIAEEMLKDIEKETVDFYPNFDDTLMQPRVLPARFPNLLVNGADGIAVGMATNIPPHNLTEVINGVQALINDPEIDIEDLMRFIPAPDYPTGGIIMGKAALRQSYKTGRGGIVIRGRAEIEDYKDRYRIIITELPYQINKALFIMKMADLVKAKKLEGISDIREESDRDGMRIVVELKREANPQVVLNSLYKQTQLQVSNGIIFLALVNNEPKILNLKEMLYYYLQHQKDVTVRMVRFDLKKAEEREHIVRGLVIALGYIDKVIAIIKSSKDRQEAQERLIQNFKLTEIQSNAILEMKLAKLTSLEVEKLQEELKQLENLITDLRDILNTPSRVLKIINDELERIKQNYGGGRKTEISQDFGDIDIEDLIPKENVVISMSYLGYIKRMSAKEYKAQRRGGVGISAHQTKDEDFVSSMFVTNSHDDLFFFTNKGKVYSIKSYEVPDVSRQSKGRAIVNLLPLSEGEKVTTLIPIKKDSSGFLVMATKKGLIKKTELSEFKNIRISGKIAISLLDDDELIGVNLSNGKNEILLASHSGRCVHFKEENVRAIGRTTQGSRGMLLDEGDYIVDMAVADKGCQLITITEKGYGKRTSIEDYRLVSRGKKGVKAGHFNEKTGNLVGLKQVDEEDDLLLIADNGIIIRTPVNEISILSRGTTLGVKIMRLKEDATIVSVARIDNEKEEALKVEELIAQQIKQGKNNEEDTDVDLLNEENADKDLLNDEN